MGLFGGANRGGAPEKEKKKTFSPFFFKNLPRRPPKFRSPPFLFEREKTKTLLVKKFLGGWLFSPAPYKVLGKLKKAPKKN